MATDEPTSGIPTHESPADDVPLVASSPRLTLAGAQSLLDAAQKCADELDVSVVIHVCDSGGHPMAMARMDDSPTFSITVAAKKAWTAAAAGAPTRAIAAEFVTAPTLLHGVAPNVDELIPVGGGVPVMFGGRIGGAIGVSGATEEQDHEIAAAAVAAVFG